jgi:uncharacterized membrane protein YoaK (UPF0700 family)
MEATKPVKPSTAAEPTRQLVASSLLAFTAGFVDTCGFVALFGLFTAHVTGNFVLIGASLVEQRSGVVGKLLALPVFILAVAATRLFVLHCERKGWNRAATVLIAQAVFLALFLAVGIAASPLIDGDAPLAILAGMMGVSAMAIQNAASRTVFQGHGPTTVMTGNVTQSVIDAVDLLFRATPEKSAATKSRFHKMWPPVIAFAAGAVAGALAYVGLGFLCLLAPILILVGLVGLSRRAYVALTPREPGR